MFPEFKKYSLYKETECMVGYNTLTTKSFDDNKIENMSNKQQTATEWFAIQLYEKMEMRGDGRVMDALLEQAKQMEKEQLIGLLKWMNEVSSETPMRLETDLDDIVEQYYNETYKK